MHRLHNRPVLLSLMTTEKNDNFFEILPVSSNLKALRTTPITRSKALPADWVLATADIVGSTEAIKQGRYKAVNVAGASVISALLNALGKQNHPFIFGGDGALVALPASEELEARKALAAVQAWVADELQLNLRAAIVPMAAVRAQGLDVRVARFKVSSGALLCDVRRRSKLG